MRIRFLTFTTPMVLTVEQRQNSHPFEWLSIELIEQSGPDA